VKRNKTLLFLGLLVWLIGSIALLVEKSLAFYLSYFLLFFLLIFTLLQTSRQEKTLTYLEKERESLTLRLEDKERIAEIFEDISRLYDKFVEKIDFPKLVEETLNCTGRILESDLLVIAVRIKDVWEKEIKSGDESAFLPKEVKEYLFTQREELLLDDLSHYPPFHLMKKQGFNRMLSTPLHTKGTIYGFIAGFNYTRNFHPNQQFLLSTLAHHIALLIENTQLLEKIKKISLKREIGKVEDLKELERRLEIEKKVEERELELARQIQQKLLPFPLPELPGWEIDALAVQSLEVGGDYFDIFPLRKNKWGVVMVDVSGKGVPAALIMVMLRTALHTLSPTKKENPKTTLEYLNQYLFRETEKHIFVSILYAIFHPEEGKIEFLNAGGEYPIIYRSKQKKIEMIKEGGLVLGLVENWENGEVKEVFLEEGDLFFLYTDGLIETLNPEGEIYGEQRLEEFLKRKGELRINELLKELEKEIKGFSWSEPLVDDITVLALKRKGKK